MAVFHECDRCNKKINEPEEKVHKINFRVSITPRIIDENITAKQMDNLDGLDFCKECATKIVKILHEPISKPENLGI